MSRLDLGARSGDAGEMGGILLAVLMAVILFPQARNAWGPVGGVAVTVVGMAAALTVGIFAAPYLLVGLYARKVAMQRALTEGDTHETSR